MNNNRLRLLLAEKDAITAVDTVNMITEIGYDITSVVDSALDAITKTETDRPDLILMDVRLRGSLNGVEAAGILSFKYNIPIVFIATPESKQLFSRDPVFCYRDCILKPVNKKILQNVIAKNVLIKSMNKNMFRGSTMPPRNFNL